LIIEEGRNKKKREGKEREGIRLLEQGAVCVKDREKRGRKEKKRRGSERVRGRKEKRKKRKKRKREKTWDTCQNLGGWEEIMLSPPSQSCADMWQVEIPYIFKAPNFNKFL
jgi:hypothetical protein